MLALVFGHGAFGFGEGDGRGRAQGSRGAGAGPDGRDAGELGRAPLRMVVPNGRERAIDALEAETSRLAGVINAAEGQLVRLVARALSEELWAQGGIVSPTQWLTWRLGCSTGHARRLLRLARRAGELPATVDALVSGRMSLDQAEVIARHVPGDHEVAAVELAEHATVPQLDRVLRHYDYGDTEAAVALVDGDDRRERRTVGFGPGSDGRWRLHADLPADDGAVVEQALVAAHQDLFHGPDHGGEANGSDGHGDAGQPRVTWADALLAVAEGSLAAGSARLPGADRYRVHLHLETRGLSAHLGGRLPDRLRRLHTCDTTYVPVLEHEGRPIATTPAKRNITDRMRRTVEHRDGGCVVPGCATTRFLQIHHITHVEDHGRTVASNLVAVCRAHHRRHHLGLLGITGDPDTPGGLHFTDRRGRELPPAPHPRPPDRLLGRDVHLPRNPPDP